MKAMRTCLLGLGLVALCSGISSGGEIELLPISASGPHTIVGNEIILDGGGQRVFLELFMAGGEERAPCDDLDVEPVTSADNLHNRLALDDHGA